MLLEILSHLTGLHTADLMHSSILASAVTERSLRDVPCLQSQKELLRQFRAGDLNCLVSTSVAEEGLDVRQCQLVVRHDLPSTLLAFIQSRGRARMAASDMVLMVDQSKQDELQFLGDALRWGSSLSWSIQHGQLVGDVHGRPSTTKCRPWTNI